MLYQKPKFEMAEKKKLNLLYEFVHNKKSAVNGDKRVEEESVSDNGLSTQLHQKLDVLKNEDNSFEENKLNGIANILSLKADGKKW